MAWLFLCRADSGKQIERWHAGTGKLRRTFQLKTSFPTKVDATISPAVTQDDLTYTLSAIYRKPSRGNANTQHPNTRGSGDRRGIPLAGLQGQRWDSGFIIIKTFPLASWEQTTITGLTADPLVLKNEYSQTYAPGHHNFSDVFLFEPRLDPNVTEGQRAELEASNIRIIHVNHDGFGGGDTVKILGFDGKFWTFP